MQGHTFSEPLRNFPGLWLLTKENDRCVRVYQMSAGQERSLSGKHAKYSTPYYQFQDGQFAMAKAVTTGTGASPMAICEEALFLFGPGKERHDLMGGLDWEGERMIYYEKLVPPVQYGLLVYSKLLRLVQ